MADRIWNGGSGDWSTASNWTTAAPAAPAAPQPGDTATIASGDATISGAEGLNGFLYNGVGLTLGDAAGDSPTLTLSSAFLSGFFSIQAAGSATIAAQGACAIACPITDSVSGSMLTLVGDASSPNGLILADGDIINIGQKTAIGTSGSLDLEGVITDENATGVNVYGDAENDATLKVIAGSGFNVYGALTGTGVVDVSNAASARLYGGVSAGQTIDFDDVAGRLQVADPGAFDGSVTGFGPGNFIDFSTVDAAAASYDASTRTLTLTDGSGATVATLQHVQAAAGMLTVTPDTDGTGTTVSYAGAPPRSKDEIADGDRAMQSDVVRATMTVPGTDTPITGAGVKVGIISGSFDANGEADANAAAGYLPANPDGTSAVHVLQDGTGDDEGQAMAEEVYQVAPGAQLYFATGGPNQASLAKAYQELQQAGCQIIACDYNPQPGPFYDVAGGLDEAVLSDIAAGVNIFDSAGNFGQAYDEQTFAPQQTTLSDGTSAQAQLFSDGTPYEPFTIQADTSARIDLQWTAPFEGTGGQGAPQALTLKLFDANGQPLSTTSFGPSTGTVVYQDGVPTTDLTVSIPSQTQATTYTAAVYLNGGQVSPQAFKMMLASTGGSGTGSGGSFDDPTAGQGSGNERAVQLIPGVNSVGASDFANSAAFGGAPSYDEFFTNSGPGSIYTDPSGNAYPSPESAGKIDFDAPDGVDIYGISEEQGNPPEKVSEFQPFFGTSAAAPDAAAVAALMLQADPGLTTAQVTALLEQSAVSQGLPAAQQGAGLIQADRAVSLALAAASTPAADPAIIGTHATSDAGERTVAPFSGVTVADTNAGATDSLAITLSGGGGTLTGAGLSGSGTSYSLAAIDPGTLTSELDALAFTPTAGQPGAADPTTFTLVDTSSAGTSATDSNTEVTDTAAATPAPVQPTPAPTPPGSTPSPAPDAVAISPVVSYANGVFTLTGTASSPAGVASVEITADVDGTATDLGAAAVAADGTFSFKDLIGTSTQTFFSATETDGGGAGAQATSADPLFSLQGGLSGGRAEQFRYTPDGSAVTTTDKFKADGSQNAKLFAPGGDTFTSAFFDTFHNREAPLSTFVFDPGFGRDVVDGFRPDNTDHDTLSLKGSDFGNSVATVLNSSRDTSAGLLITDPVASSPGPGPGNHDTILLRGITKQMLTTYAQQDIAFHA